MNAGRDGFEGSVSTSDAGATELAHNLAIMPLRRIRSVENSPGLVHIGPRIGLFPVDEGASDESGALLFYGNTFRSANLLRMISIA